MAAAFLLVSPPGWSAPDDAEAKKRLKGVERALKKDRKNQRALKRKADALQKEMRDLGRQLVTAAAALQNHEAKVSEFEVGLERLRREEEAKVRRLEQDHGQFARVLMALERLARRPPEALIVQPLGATNMVCSAILLRSAVPRIEERAGRLRREVLALAETRRHMDRRRHELAAAAAAMEEKRLRLDALLSIKKKARRQTEMESKKLNHRASAMARQAQSMREFLKSLRAKRLEKKKVSARPDAGAIVKPLPGRSIKKARGTLPFPAVGRLVEVYGQASATGLTRKGIVIETRPGAQVVAPHGGRVVFAGRFRGYGQLLIIEHGEGYHSLLAGLERIDNAIGQIVSAGEPVGVMRKPKGQNPTLYVELRRNGQPINPLPWLAARKGKVSG